MIPVHHRDEIPDRMSADETADFWKTHEVTPQLWAELDDRDLFRIIAGKSRAERRSKQPTEGPDIDHLTVAGHSGLEEITLDMPPPEGSRGGFSQAVLDLLVGQLTDIACDETYRIAEVTQATRLPNGGARITFLFIGP